MSLVALFIHIIKRPYAFLSSVPVCPTFFILNFFLIIYTISNDV